MIDRPIEPTAPAAAPSDALMLDRYHHEIQQEIGKLYEALGKPAEVGEPSDYVLPDAPLRHVIRLAIAALSTEAAPAEPAEAPETLTDAQIDEQFRVACRAQGWSDFERSGGIYCLAGVQLRWEMFKAGRATSPTALQEGAETPAVVRRDAIGGYAGDYTPMAEPEPGGCGFLVARGRYAGYCKYPARVGGLYCNRHDPAARSPTQEPHK